jgi:hypothetical protein
LNNGISFWSLVKKKQLKEQLTLEQEKIKDLEPRELMSLMSTSTVSFQQILLNTKDSMKKHGIQPISVQAVVDMVLNKQSRRNASLYVETANL